LRLDALEKDLERRLSKYSQSVMTRAREEVQKPFEAFLEKVEAIRTSGRYTGDGERAELRLAAEAMFERLTALRGDTVAKLETQLADRRATALQSKPATDPTTALLNELRQRELRDYLRTLDPLRLRARIRQAVSDGANTELLDALEGAPAGFPIAPPGLVQEARAAIADRDHPELGELAALKQTYEYLIGTATEAVKAVSSDFGTAPAKAPVDTRTPFTLSGTAVPEAKP
jgi:hypothetical protein